MKKLQAAMRDNASKAWKQSKSMFKIGSTFKGCRHCGITEWREMPNGNEKEFWTTGTNVYRSYLPQAIGWTYWCWDCGAKDEPVWDNAIDIGLEPILGARDVVMKKKYALRQEHINATAKAKVVVPSRTAKIDELERQLEQLRALIKAQS